MIIIFYLLELEMVVFLTRPSNDQRDISMKLTLSLEHNLNVVHHLLSVHSLGRPSPDPSSSANTFKHRNIFILFCFVLFVKCFVLRDVYLPVTNMLLTDDRFPESDAARLTRGVMDY